MPFFPEENIHTHNTTTHMLFVGHCWKSVGYLMQYPNQITTTHIHTYTQVNQKFTNTNDNLTTTKNRPGKSSWRDPTLKNADQDANEISTVRVISFMGLVDDRWNRQKIGKFVCTRAPVHTHLFQVGSDGFRVRSSSSREFDFPLHVNSTPSNPLLPAILFRRVRTSYYLISRNTEFREIGFGNWISLTSGEG